VHEPGRVIETTMARIPADAGYIENSGEIKPFL
jgi:hypothetical protein